MSESVDPQVQRARERQEFWKEVVWPTARGLERFFWSLLWFALLVCILFSFNPFR